MKRALCPWFAVLVAISCTGERAPANDTALPEGSPPEEEPRTTPRSTWNAAAGAVFAIRTGTGSVAWLVNPAFGDAQALDTLTAGSWNVEGTSLTMLDGAQVIGTGRVSTIQSDSTCVGWPTTTLTAASGSIAWRLAFPEGAVEGIAFDSLPLLPSADSTERTRAGALAASRLPDDTVIAFRGRPFIVRQASRFIVAGDTVGTIFEVVRLVAQEANPLQEQLLLITEEGSSRPMEVVFHRREIAAEEAMGSIELLGVLRVTASGRLAVLVRRERESGFVLEWIERSSRGTWTVRWRSATDSC